MGMPIAAPAGRAPALAVVDSGVFDQFASGEIAPLFTVTRTNSILYSQDVSQSNWTKSNVSVDSSEVAAPNDTITAQAITGAANTSSRKTAQTLSLVAGLTHTYSAYVKAKAFSHVRLFINDGTVEYRQDFNITAGSAGDDGAGSNVLRQSIEKIDENWFRVALTAQIQNSNDNATFGVLSMAANNTPSVQVAVGGTVLMHVWGQQFEQDITANAYIPTAASTNTAADANLNDVNSIWDFDGTNLMVQADPSDEGFWDSGANIITGFTNGSTFDLSSFGSSGNNITSAIVSSAFAGAASNALTLADGDVVTVKFNYTKTSGNDLRVLFGVNANGAASAVSNTVNISSSGFQSHDFTITATGTAHLQLGTGNSGHSINFSATDISADIFEITPLDV